MSALKNLVERLAENTRAFLPAPMHIDGSERLRACIGALLGLLLTGIATHFAIGSSSNIPLLIAPMGASAVLLFAVPASPLAQPWALIGGNLVSALIGVACTKLLSDPLAAASLAAAGAIAAMFALRCLHPPSGAVALTAVLGGPSIHALGFSYILAPVGLNSLLLLLGAMLYNNLTRRRYPHPAHVEHRNSHATRDKLPTERVGFSSADLDAVLNRYNQVLDIGRDDLEEILQQTEMQAYHRRFGEIRCEDCMSRDVVSVRADTPLREAWALLRRHKIRALPVVDKNRQLLGIVTLTDLLRGHDLTSLESARRTVAGLLRGQSLRGVGSVMTRHVTTARVDAALITLIPALSRAGLHHIPIVDDANRLAGMLTQSDLLAALYRARMEEMPGEAPLLRKAA